MRRWLWLVVALSLSLASCSVDTLADIGRASRTATATKAAEKNGDEIVGIYDHWESLTQLQRTEFERSLVGRTITERCLIGDVRKDGRIDLECGQRGLKTVMLFGVPTDQVVGLNKGQQYRFTATVRKMAVSITNDLQLDWVSSP